MKIVTLLRNILFLLMIGSYLNTLLRISKNKFSGKLSQPKESQIYREILTELFSSNKSNILSFTSRDTKPVNQQRTKLFNPEKNSNLINNITNNFNKKENFNFKKAKIKNILNRKIKKLNFLKYNMTVRNIMQKKYWKHEKKLIELNKNQNFSLTHNQTFLIKEADLFSKNRSNWDDTFSKISSSSFFPYKEITIKVYKDLFNQVKSNANSKVSQPFFTILKRAHDLFDKNILEIIKKEVRKIRKMSIDKATNKIIEFGEKIKQSKFNENIYWYYFSIVSEVILSGRLVCKNNNKTCEIKSWDITQNKPNRDFLKIKDNYLNEGESKIPNKRLLRQGIDKYYDYLFEKDEEYSDILEFYRLITMNQILKTEIGTKVNEISNRIHNASIESNSTTLSLLEYLRNKNSKIDDKQLYFLDKVRSYNSTQNLQFNDIRFSIFLLRQIQKTFLFKELAHFPKGVIHHLHWSASFFMGDILAGVEKLIDENYEKNLITVVIKAEVYLQDRVRPDEYNELPTPRLFIIENLVDLLNRFYSGKYLNDIKNFKENYILGDGRCIIDPVTPLGESNKVDSSIKAYLIFLICKKSYMYSKVMDLTEKLNVSFINKKKFTHFSKLSKYLQSNSHVLNPGKILKKYFLPKVYKNMLYTFKDQNSVSVWIKFENIFGIYADLIDNLNVFKYLNKMLLKELHNDKVMGVEFRQKYDIGKPDSRMELLKNMTYEKAVKDPISNQTVYETVSFPVSFIIPGRKVKKEHKLDFLASSLKKASKMNDEYTVGFDFFGYEDDPFSGARNFFPFTLRKFNDQAGSKKISKLQEIFNPSKSDKQNNDKKDKTENVFPTLLNLLRDGNKLYLHAGETMYFPNYPVDRAFLKKFYINDNLIHSVLLPNVERLGHGFASGSNDLIMNILRRKNISLEICPVSNQALKYYSVSENPLTKLLREGVKVTISPDDPGLFFYSGVRMDWFNLIMQTDLLPSEYYILLRNSIMKSSIKEIKENSQIYLNELKVDMEAFFNSENYKIFKKQFPNNEDLREYLKLGKHNGVRFSKTDMKVKNPNTNIIINVQAKKDNHNPYLNIYDIENLVSELKKPSSKKG